MSYRRLPPPRPLPREAGTPALAAAAAAAAAKPSSDFGARDDRGHIRTVLSHPAVSTASPVAAKHEIPPPPPVSLLRNPPLPAPRLLELKNLLFSSPVSHAHSSKDASWTEQNKMRVANRVSSPA